jgi:hypothetical protein
MYHVGSVVKIKISDPRFGILCSQAVQLPNSSAQMHPFTFSIGQQSDII